MLHIHSQESRSIPAAFFSFCQFCNAVPRVSDYIQPTLRRKLLSFRLHDAVTFSNVLVHTNMTTDMWAEVRYLSAVAIFPSVGRHLESFYGEVASTAGLRMHSSSSSSFILVESFAIILML